MLKRNTQRELDTNFIVQVLRFFSLPHHSREKGRFKFHHIQEGGIGDCGSRLFCLIRRELQVGKKKVGWLEVNKKEQKIKEIQYVSTNVPECSGISWRR